MTKKRIAKHLYLIMAFVMLFSMLPGVQVKAATTEAPQYIAMNFDTQWSGNSVPGATEVNGTATWTNTDTHNGSKGAMAYVSGTYPSRAVRFPLRTLAGNKYHISAWLKFDETPNTQDVYFILYNAGTDGTSLFNQLKTKHDTIVAGQWVQCSVTFNADGKAQPGTGEFFECVPDGQIELRVGSGNPANDMPSGKYAYTMDDFHVYPDIVKQDVSSVEKITNGSFENGSSSNLSGWKQNYSQASISALRSGAQGTAYALKSSTNTWGSSGSIPGTTESVDIQYGKQYTLTYWAKALDDRTEGSKPAIYLKYSGETYLFMYSKGSKTLTDQWQQFEYDINVGSYYASRGLPTLTFRMVASGYDIKEAGPANSYAIDEVSLKQVDDHFDFTVKAYGGADATKGAVYQMAHTRGENRTFLYRLYQETGSGDVLLANGHTDNGYVYFPASLLPSNRQSVRLDVVAGDAYGDCTEKKEVYLENISYEDAISIRSNQTFWNCDTTHLSATVSYQNEGSKQDVKVIVAQYKSENEMVSASAPTEIVSAGEDKIWTVTAPAHPEATKAKFFVWQDGTFAPIKDYCELTKTTEGEFVYVDAKSTASTANGAFATPFKTINAAVAHVKTLSNSPEENIYVLLKSGEYNSTVNITADINPANKNIIFTSLDGEKAKITGAKHITGFTKDPKNSKIYRAPVPAGTTSRQLYVNGVMATRARSEEDRIWFQNLDAGATADTFANNGLRTVNLTQYAYPTEIELVFIQDWRHQFICPDAITQQTVNGRNYAYYTFADGKNKGKWQTLVYGQGMSLGTPNYLENAYELLDKEGEWYLDTHTNYLYYYPRYFEDINTADVVLPGLESLMKVTGTADAPVKNITFQNIDFEYTTYNRPTTNRGFTERQNGTFNHTNSLGEQVTLMDAAVEVFNGHDITFDNCDFSRIGSMALKMTGAIQHCNVIGNEFYEIGGSALYMGEVRYDVENPANNPMDSKYYVTDNLIANNYIHKVATVFHSTTAIGLGFPRNTVVRNNDISDGSYSGIHTGWGWTEIDSSVTQGLVIEKNYIHNFLNYRLYDGAGIYTLGPTSGTEANPNAIRKNYIQDIGNIYGGIYTDNASSNWWISDNVIDFSNNPVPYGKGTVADTLRWFFVNDGGTNIQIGKNYSTTPIYINKGTNINYTEPDVSADANWSAAAASIIAEAGIEDAYKDRFDFGMQTVRMPIVYRMTVGQTADLIYEGLATEERYCDTSDYEVRVSYTDQTYKSATATEPRVPVITITNSTITAKGAGTDWITLKLLKRDAEGKVQYYDEYKIRVVVE